MRDRFPLLVLALIAFALAGGWLLHQSAARGRFAAPLSTYRSAPDGSRAILLLAGEAGLPVRRRHLDLAQIEAEVKGIALLGIRSLPGEELEKLKAFVAEGGNLLIAAAAEQEKKEFRFEEVFDASRLLHDAFQVELTPCDSPEIERELLPAVASALTRGVEQVEARVDGYLGRKGDEPFLPLIVDPHHENDPVAIVFPHGGGKVVVVASHDLASNRVLARADNAQLWLSILGAMAGDGVVELDEHHHGFTGQRSISEYAQRYGMHWALLQLLLAAWLWVASHRRFGAPRAVVGEQRIASADYLLAMARIYRLGGHRDHAARLLIDGLSRFLAGKAGLSAHAGARMISARLANRGRRDLARALAVAVEGSDSAAETDHALLSLAQKCAAARKLADSRAPPPRKRLFHRDQGAARPAESPKQPQVVRSTR
ncbi:MAG: DUF4350 domain-containing protein [Myxococcales bacterium]|jgi:hypothetical protein